jgi:putative resolvase
VPARKLSTGTILPRGPACREDDQLRALYARVFAHDQQDDLDRQLGRLATWAARQGLVVTHMIAEARSGLLNGNLPKLNRLLADPTVTTIVVERRDRLTRFGAKQRPPALAVHGRRVLVADPGKTNDDPLRDMVDELTSCCASLYARQGARSWALRALTRAKRETGAAAGGTRASRPTQPAR